MKIRHWLYLASSLAIAACAASSSSFLAGRQALLRGEPDNAVNYFNPIAQADPSYVVTSAPPRKSIWTYLGRAYYNSGRYAEAKVALDRALTYLKDDYVAQLYRGLTILRGDTAPPPASAFTLQEISYALREGVAPRRVGTIARERGVAFDLNVETESQLRSAGADSILLDDLKKIRAERAKQSHDERQTAQRRRQRNRHSLDRTARLARLHDCQHHTGTLLGSFRRNSRGNLPGTTGGNDKPARLGNHHQQRRIGGL